MSGGGESTSSADIGALSVAILALLAAVYALKQNHDTSKTTESHQEKITEFQGRTAAFQTTTTQLRQRMEKLQSETQLVSYFTTMLQGANLIGTKEFAVNSAKQTSASSERVHTPGVGYLHGIFPLAIALADPPFWTEVHNSRNTITFPNNGFTTNEEGVHLFYFHFKPCRDKYLTMVLGALEPLVEFLQ